MCLFLLAFVIRLQRNNFSLVIEGQFRVVACCQKTTLERIYLEGKKRCGAEMRILTAKLCTLAPLAFNYRAHLCALVAKYVLTLDK